MAASSSTLCDPYTKEMPPSFASAIAIVSFETDCIIADTIGMFRESGHSSCPFLYFTSGVFRLTAAGMHSAEE